MKIILDFNLPEEDNEFKLAMRGSDFFAALWDIRNEIKKCDENNSIEESFNKIREIIYDIKLDDIE